MASVPEELVAGGDLEDGAHVAPGPHRNHQLPDGHAEDFVEVVVDAHAVVLRVGRPLDQLDHDVDALALADRGDAEEILDVEDAEAPHLEVVAEQLGGLAEDHARRAVVALDHVVGDQAVAAHHEIERALALADRARADEQEAHAEHVDQHAVERGAWGEAIVEQRVDRGDGAARALFGHEERRAAVVGGGHQLGGCERAAGDDDAREVEIEEPARGLLLCNRRERLKYESSVSPRI